MGCGRPGRAPSIAASSARSITSLWSAAGFRSPRWPGASLARRASNWTPTKSPLPVEAPRRERKTSQRVITPESLEVVREVIEPDTVKAEPENWKPIARKSAGNWISNPPSFSGAKPSGPNTCAPTIVRNRRWWPPRRCASQIAARPRNAVVLTLVQNCRMHGVNPEEYLKDVLERLPRMTNQDDLKQLTPLNWKKAREQSLRRAA